MIFVCYLLYHWFISQFRGFFWLVSENFQLVKYQFPIRDSQKSQSDSWKWIMSLCKSMWSLLSPPFFVASIFTMRLSHFLKAIPAAIEALEKFPFGPLSFPFFNPNSERFRNYWMARETQSGRKCSVCENSRFYSFFAGSFFGLFGLFGLNNPSSARGRWKWPSILGSNGRHHLRKVSPPEKTLGSFAPLFPNRRQLSRAREQKKPRLELNLVSSRLQDGGRLWRNLRQIHPLPLQLCIFCKFFPSTKRFSKPTNGP